MAMGPESAVVDSLVFAAAGSPVDFDATMFLMLGIFIGLLFYLKHTVFQPYLVMRDARDARTEDARRSAREMDVRAEETLTRYETQLTGAREVATASRSGLRSAAKEQEAEILNAARNEVNLIVSRSRDELEGQLEGARTALTREAESLSTLIVDRVLG